MKKLALAALTAFSMFGCSYGAMAASGDKVVVLRNDMFLMGALRAAYVCKVTDGGLTECNSSQSP